MTKSTSLIPHKWLDWAREIQALAQTGNTYAVNEWQSERYDRLMEIAAEIVGENTTLPVQPVLENFRVQPGYATPKIDVRGAVFREGKLLMVKESRDGGWTMPGGWVDVGDYPAAAAEREVWEESGFEVKARKLIGVYDANRVEPMEFYHAFKLVFLCEILGGEAKTSNETTDVMFYSLDEVPVNFSGERTRPRHVRDAFAALADPSIPTVFD
jgi:ADP-ribose pyrophosphatase YjhB (NUDIX family)